MRASPLLNSGMDSGMDNLFPCCIGCCNMEMRVFYGTERREKRLEIYTENLRVNLRVCWCHRICNTARLRTITPTINPNIDQTNLSVDIPYT